MPNDKPAVDDIEPETPVAPEPEPEPAADPEPEPEPEPAADEPADDKVEDARAAGDVVDPGVFPAQYEVDDPWGSTPMQMRG